MIKLIFYNAIIKSHFLNESIVDQWVRVLLISELSIFSLLRHYIHMTIETR